MIWIFCCLWIGFAIAGSARADAPASSSSESDTIVVTANRLDTPESEVASSETIIGPDEIRRQARDQVSNLLRDVPGLNVEANGGPGQPASVFIRGTDSDHVLVLIDGVEANDPLSPSRAFDFGNLSSADIERIEVIRGSQSVLYGSEAIGGVINIITKKGHAGPPQADFQAEYGNYETYRVGASIRGGGEKSDYALGVTQQGTQGFPAADRALGNVVDTGQRELTLSGQGDLELAPGARISAMARYTDSSFGLSAGGGPPGYDIYGDRIGDDPGSQGTDREFYGKLEAVRKMSEVWQADLALHYTDIHRTTSLNEVGLDFQDTPPTLLDGGYDQFDSHRIRGVVQNNFFLTDEDTLTAGLELATETGSSTEIYSAGASDTGLKDQSDFLEAAFLQDQWLSPVFFATAGLRYDAYRNIGSQATYRVAPGARFAVSGTTLKGSVGTGFKIPSLYQRYSSFGDPSLSPERSTSYDAGFEQELGSSALVLGVTYFQTDFDELIDYDSATQHYFNVGKASSQGVETELKARLGAETEAKLTYTYTLAKDDRTGAPLLHRPKHAASLDVDRDIGVRAQAGFQARLVGARADQDPVDFAPVQMGSYAIFSVRARCRIGGGLSAFARLDNLLDRAYEEVDGYGTAGRSFYFGLNEEI